MWDLSRPDWQARMLAGQSIMPDLPLIQSEAKLGLQFFDELQLPDVPGKPRMRDACGEWFRDLVRASFGSWDPVTRTRFIRDIFALAPKGSSKTSYSAGLMITLMLMNQRPRAEALFIGPTQAVSDRAYEQSVGMIEASPALKNRFRTRDHIKTVVDHTNGSEMKVKTFDLNILTGSILIFALLDELHLLGKNQHTAKVLRQVRGGLNKTPEGLLLITTTQSDAVPAGAFKSELATARKMRDGGFKGMQVRPMLPLLYEFPPHIAKDQALWEDPENWPMVMPNLGRSIHMSDLVPDWQTEKAKTEQDRKVWASQHLNIEIGVGMKSDGWPGAEFWGKRVDATLTLETLIERCELVVVGIDGGGLDDLFGLTAVGREKETKRWLTWSHAWCHEGVLERRQSIASVLRDFEASGELTIVDDELEDISEIVGIVVTIDEAGVLHCVAIDTEGPYGEFVEELAQHAITAENGKVIGVSQGYKLMNAIKTAERKLANGTMVHAASSLMDWCVENVRIEPTATAIRATKQNAGDQKIDPVMALFDAVTVMITNPELKVAPVSVYERIAQRRAAERQQQAAQ